MTHNRRGQIAHEMAGVRRKNGGRATPALVLKFAETHPKSAIYRRIDSAGLWDDSTAAHRARLLFCQQLILRVRVQVLIGEKKIPQRVMVSMLVDRGVGGGYVSYVTAMRTRVGRQKILETALFELRAFQKKYAMLKELAPIFAEIRKLEDLVGGGVEDAE